MVILLILMIGTVSGFDLKCPARSEWRWRANVSCYLESKYVCLFHLLEGKYEENCLGSDQSSIGSKLVFQPLFNLAKCNTDRYQPIVFTTYGNSECIIIKSKCAGEGQVVYSNESDSIDIACRCDYTKGYAHVSKPQNSCFCIPSEEDCSCFKVECTQLSADYQCIPDENITNVNCEEIHPQMSYSRHNRTVRIIQNEIHRYSNGRLVSYIILILLAFYSIIAVITVVAIEYKDRKRKHLKSKDDEKHRFIQELFLKGECGKHHFARLIFIGKNGVGKTSLMRRLLWKNKKDVISTLSTDGIEVEKCNINITNGKWSPCDEIDDDLARLIQRVYTKKKEQEEQESERNPGEKIFVEVITNYNEEEAKTVLGNNEEVLSEKNQVDELSKATHSENEEEYNIDRLHEEEITKDDSESDEKLAIEIKEGRMHTIKLDRLQNVEMEDSNSNQTEPETRQFRHSNDISIINNEIENESGSENDEKVDKLTSNIMESCFHWNEDDPLDKQAFCWLWDFAGQKDFYATHQVFLSTCAVYLLVTDSLDFSCAEKLWVDFENSAQYVRFWFDAIHCYWSTTQKNRLDPPIIVVCTKEDKFKDQTKRKKRQMKFEDSLAKVLSSQKKKAHLRNIYFVSNTEDNDDVFEEIRKNISLHAMTMNDWGRDCPLKWLLFQQVLVKLKDGKVPISNITKLLKIARHEQIGITDYEEFTLCLQYYHNIGTIIYFDEENLKEYVILDPKWLIDAFRCLVSDKIEKVIRVSDDWLKLKEQGELTDSLISLLFEKEPNLKFSENKAHLIEVMKRFDIIVNLRNSTVFYMPCMMESCSFVNVQKQFMNQGQSFDRTSWLCLDFDFLPPAFFNHILAWYIKQYSVSVILDKRLLYLRNALYRQIGVFDLDSSGCEKLVVCEGPNIIALQVWNSRMPAQTYGDIGKHLFQFVDTLRDRYRMKIVYKKKFKCKDGDFTFDRRQIDKLFVVEYHCLEHRTTHLSDDLLKPWGFLKNIQLLREQEIAHMRH